MGTYSPVFVLSARIRHRFPKSDALLNGPFASSPDAKNTATSSREFIRLIDGDEFIDMWQNYYDKMSDEDKNMLPLKKISFLGNNE